MVRNLISVVDDDESICRSTSLLIYSFGYRAATFASAEDFLGSGLRRDTSCLILDIRMPGMNGLQLQSNLSAEGCGIPIIFITAHDDKEPCRQAIQAGAVGFLRKPFSDVQLLQIIRSALQHNENRVTTEEYT